LRKPPIGGRDFSHLNKEPRGAWKGKAKKASKRKVVAKVAAKVAKAKKPGVIDTLVTVLQAAPAAGLSVEQILKKLTERCKGHKRDALETTTRCQLARLSDTRGLKIKKRREGRTVFYRANA
jgi:hypothetical protein